MQLHQITLALACGIAVSFVPASLRQPRAVARFGAYESAVAEAESAASKFGKQSPEAKTAWAAVEEIESADNSAATKQESRAIASGLWWARGEVEAHSRASMAARSRDVLELKYASGSKAGVEPEPMR